jgi:hypothetical protein
MYIETRLLGIRIIKLLLRNGSVNTPVARQGLGTSAALARNKNTRHAASPVASRWRNKHLSATAVTSCNNRRTAGSGVFC